MRLQALALAVALTPVLIGRHLASVRADEPKPAPGLFRRDNLVAWCIVPFDAKKRGPEDRAAMLAKLGFKRFAYDYRAEHMPQGLVKTPQELRDLLTYLLSERPPP